MEILVIKNNKTLTDWNYKMNTKINKNQKLEKWFIVLVGLLTCKKIITIILVLDWLTRPGCGIS